MDATTPAPIHATTPDGLIVPIDLNDLRAEIGEALDQAVAAIVTRKIRTAHANLPTVETDSIGVGQ